MLNLCEVYALNFFDLFDNSKWNMFIWDMVIVLIGYAVFEIVHKN